MVSNSLKISRGLVLLSVLVLHNVCARSVRPVTFGYELGSPSEDLLSDLSFAAAEPRPVYVELVDDPLSLSLVANRGVASAGSVQAPVISASEKIEKVLRRPMAFSMNHDQVNAASHHVSKSPKEKHDQQPAAIDYYKYLARLEGEEKDSGAAPQEDKDEILKEENSEKKEIKEEEKGKADLRRKSKPHIFLTYSPSNFYQEFAKNPAVAFHKNQEKKSEKVKEEKKSNDHATHEDSHHHHPTHEDSHHHHPTHEDSHHHHPTHEDSHHHHHADAGDKAEASESNEEHKEESRADNHDSGSDGGHKQDSGSDGSHKQDSGSDGSHKQDSASEEGHKQEEVQASASHHGGGGGGGGGGGQGGGGNYKKGGGKEFKQTHDGEHGEVGEKKYSGHHHHEKGEKGHKDKDDHVDEYDEKKGIKHGHHDEDGYEAEHHHGEDGKKGTQFHEEGEHSKGHSTKGEHNIHKKDEYEKKQEFYDESHEGGEHEKHGEYFHEDDYHKGGHHKSSHEKGGKHEEHYGKKGHHEEGGHKHEDKGHKQAVGREVHHDHQEKEGEDSSAHEGKKWQYKKGDGGGGGGDSKGAHQHVQEVVKDGKAEASEHGKVKDNKKSDYHIVEVISEKRALNGDGKLETAEDHGEELHGEHSLDAFTQFGFGDNQKNANADNGNNGDAAHHGLRAPPQEGGSKIRHLHSDEEVKHVRLQEAETKPENTKQRPIQVQGTRYASDAIYPNLYGAETRLQKAEEQVIRKNNYGDDDDVLYGLYGAEARPINSETQPINSYGYLYGAETRPQNAVQPSLQRSSYPGDPVHPYTFGDHPQESHVHPNGEICPGSQHSYAGTAPVVHAANPEPASQPQAEESAPKSHVLVVGNDGNIYGILPHGGAWFHEAP